MVPVAHTDSLEVRRMAVGGLGRLVAALRLPPTPRTRGLVPACLVPVAALPWIVFIGPGDHLLHPRVPTGACGLPILAVQISLNSLRWKTLSITRRIPVDITRRIPVDPRPVNGKPVPNKSPSAPTPKPRVLS